MSPAASANRALKPTGRLIQLLLPDFSTFQPSGSLLPQVPAMPHIDNDVKLDFKDVLLRPKRSTLKSRSEVSLLS